MSILKSLLESVDQLNPNELEQLHHYIMGKRQQLTPDEAMLDAKIAALNEALVEFREGFSAESWAEIADAMNTKVIEPDDSSFDWLDDVPEQER